MKEHYASTALLLKKIFTRTNISKVIVIFLVGFLSRYFINEHLSTNVFIEYLTMVSIIFYSFFATFVVFVNELFSFFNVNIIPNFMINIFSVIGIILRYIFIEPFIYLYSISLSKNYNISYINDPKGSKIGNNNFEDDSLCSDPNCPDSCSEKDPEQPSNQDMPDSGGSKESHDYLFMASKRIDRDYNNQIAESSTNNTKPINDSCADPNVYETNRDNLARAPNTNDLANLDRTDSQSYSGANDSTAPIRKGYLNNLGEYESTQGYLNAKVFSWLDSEASSSGKVESLPSEPEQARAGCEPPTDIVKEK
jgi:hypothetical protein